MEVDRGEVGPEYLRTVRTALLAGREFTDSDDAGARRVSIVNKALADRYWPGQDALGKRLQIAGHWTTVVGVAANGKSPNHSLNRIATVKSACVNRSQKLLDHGYPEVVLS